jgi:hypothetical protein
MAEYRFDQGTMTDDGDALPAVLPENPGNGIHGPLLQLLKSLCSFDLKQMGFMPEVSERVRLARCDIVIELALPGAHEDLPQTVQILDVEIGLGKGMFCRLSGSDTAAAINLLVLQVADAITQCPGLFNTLRAQL